MTDRPLPVTERAGAQRRALDTLATAALVDVFAREQTAAAEAVRAAGPAIAAAVDAIVARLRAGGTLQYFGAGTSGRLAVLDAAECPPTFGTPPGLVRAHIAGGPAALVAAVEGAEDDAEAGARDARAGVTAADAVVGISASGGAPYVVQALETARARGAFTVALTAVADSALARACELVIVVETGPEPIVGSTRLKAGTAQKLVLNAISSATMVRLGKVYDDRMVDVVATNAKLRERARRLVEELVPTSTAHARELLAAAGGSVKVGVAMGRLTIAAADAHALLERHHGSLRALIGPATPAAARTESST